MENIIITRIDMLPDCVYDNQTSGVYTCSDLMTCCLAFKVIFKESNTLKFKLMMYTIQMSYYY